MSVIALALLLASCAPPELRDQNLLRDDSLLTDDPCEAPCWRGITPGVTTWSAALTILEDDPTLSNVTTQQDEASAARVAEFQQEGGAAGCCQMYSEDGETVSVIFLRTAPTVTLGQLIESKGDPSYVLGTPFSDNQAIVNLVYPDLSLVIYAFVAGAEGSLSETSEIIGVLYVTPEDMELLILTSELHAWEGYQSYNVYSDQSPYEVTPAITMTPTGTITPQADGTPESTAEATESAGS